jgi:ubiquitin carboxyl-terminal hydrolase 4/11/15
MYDGSQLAVSPRQFKSTLGKYSPIVAGWGQQDSQEFMSFLLDGLHEDLNRIEKKPYIENPESDETTVNNPQAIKDLGEQFRENHRARNDSVATDLFGGFYKNKLVCPVCDKVSITFDPYSLLTLQLPHHYTWEHTFTFIPVHGPPIQIDVDNEKGSTMAAVKDFVASRIAGTSPEKMLSVELFSHKVYRVFEDRTPVIEANLQARDDMVIYELEDVPTNYPPPKKKTRSMLDVDSKAEPDVESSEDERQLVTVLQRVASPARYSTSKGLALWPTMITLSKAEASSYDEILRKILRNVSNMTTRPFLDEFAAAESAVDAQTSEEDDDTVTSTDEDEDEDEDNSSADANVKTRSLMSEDGIIDVSMTDGDEATKRSQSKSPAVILNYNVLQKGAPIPAKYKELFDIRFTNANDPVPTGFAAYDGVRQFPLLSSRIPKVAERRSSLQSSTSLEPTDASDDSDADEPTEQAVDAQMSYDVDQSEPSSMMHAKHASKKNRRGKSGKSWKHARGGRKFAKKGNRPTSDKQMAFSSQISEEDTTEDVDGRLVRPNDVLILDWDLEKFEPLFGGGVGKTSELGVDTRKSLELLSDPVLDRRRHTRADRKKAGVSLEDCFIETSKDEILTEGNAWYCSRCKESRLANKQLEIWTVPDILVVHLKRFGAGRGFSHKIDDLVDFPVEGLDLTGKVGVTEGKKLVYDLFAVDNHFGGSGGGHYTAYAKNFVDDEWYLFNGNILQYSRISLKRN